PAGRRQWGAGQRHVDPVVRELLLQLGASQRRAPLLAQLLQRLACDVRGLADRTALLGRQLRDAAQHVRQLGSAAEVLDPRLLERVGRLGGGDRRLPLLPQCVDPLDHAGGILWSVATASRVTSYSATVAAIAALSDSLWIGIRTTRSAAASSSAGRPARSAPTT